MIGGLLFLLVGLLVSGKEFVRSQWSLTFISDIVRAYIGDDILF